MHNKNPSADLDLAFVHSVLEDIDSRKHLYRSAIVLAFVVSGVMGGLAFFLTLDFTEWLGIDVVEPWMQITLPYALSLLVLMLSFLAFLSSLYSMGFRDLDSVVRDRLFSLNLSCDVLHGLQRDLALKEYKHKHIFECAVNDLLRHRMCT